MGRQIHPRRRLRRPPYRSRLVDAGTRLLFLLVTAHFLQAEQEVDFVGVEVVEVGGQGFLDEIEQLGSPQEIYDGPRTVFVADFLGAENILPVTSHGSTRCAGDGSEPRPRIGALRRRRCGGARWAE
ncbi:hypothetical protein GCM10023317_16210 [Actinopolymorpha pittospori]